MRRPRSGKFTSSLSGALKKAVRWHWIGTSPIEAAEPPPARKPRPEPPTAKEAARLLEEAFREPEWGLLVWLVMVTGLRRGELCSIRWRHVDLERGTLMLHRSIAQRGRKRWEKDTKSHQQRRLALDEETLDLLRQHRARCEVYAQAIDARLAEEAFVFSRAADGSTHLVPSSVSQRYSKLAQRLGIKTSIHKLRHYSATELISAGVDVRTVAGRLGHGGGGTTTLRVYAAWVEEADQRASSTLFSRLPARPGPVERPASPQDFTPSHPYELVALAVREEIAAGRWAVNDRLPSLKDLAQGREVSVSTVQRAVKLLESWGLVDVVTGRGVRVRAFPA